MPKIVGGRGGGVRDNVPKIRLLFFEVFPKDHSMLTLFNEQTASGLILFKT